MKIRHLTLHAAFSVLMPVLISACAGGGSDGSSTPTLELAPPASSPARGTQQDRSGLYTNAYMNLKGIWTTGAPPQLALSEYARVFGRFDSSGHLGMFSAHKTYTTSDANNTTATAAEATPARLVFSSWNDTLQRYEENADLMTSPTSASACSDVRKSLVADFNGDGRSDVFITCIGWTHPPYPGDTNRVVLSQSNGRYDIQNVPALSRAFTSATASDLDGDGDVDVVLLTDSDTTPLQVLLNDGHGQFALETSHRMPQIGHGYYTVEMADVNGDDLLDLLVGGHEVIGERPTRIFINPGNNLFIGVDPLTVPKATDTSGADILDFAVTGTTDRALWVLRTSHAGHQGRVVQRVLWSELNAASPQYNAVFTAPTGAAHWITPAHVNGSTALVSDDPAMTTLMLQTPTLTQLP